MTRSHLFYILYIMKSSKCIAEFNAYFSPSRKCIAIDGEGEAEIKLTADATQLAGVIGALAQCGAKVMTVKFYTTPGVNDGKKQIGRNKTYKG